MQPSRRELRSLPALIWAAFRGAWGAVVGLIGVAATVGAWFVSPQETVPLAWFVGLAMLCALLGVTLFEAARRALAYALKPLPKVRLAVDETASGGSVVLVLDESSLFSTGMAISLFIIEHNDYEIRLGSGYVDTIREDGRIQVRLVNFVKGRQAHIDKVRQNDATALKNARVKPFLPWDDRITSPE